MSQFQTTGPIDRTPGTPGSDKYWTDQSWQSWHKSPKALILIGNAWMLHLLACQVRGDLVYQIGHLDPHAGHLGHITGQYCGRLLKFSAHSLNVLGIRYKVFKYVFLLIISYIHIYETIFQICFFYWWYHIYIYTRPYWDAISWDNSYMMIIWSTWPLKIPNT